jgi:hypothetical protein
MTRLRRDAETRRGRLAAAWRAAWRSRSLRAQIVATPLGVAGALAALSAFLVRIEARPGVVLPDPLLAAFRPRNCTGFTFGAVYLALALGLTVLAFRPRALLIGLQAYIVMIGLRMLLMVFTPLAPPLDAIPLADPIIETLGTGRPVTRDLFFSGHTSTLFLLFLCVPGRRSKALLLVATAFVAGAVLLQHVHYTVDVLVAPLCAFASYRCVATLHGSRSRV